MIRRQEKKELLRQQERGEATNTGVGGAVSHDLTGFLRQQNRTLVDLHWQIIQVYCIMQNYAPISYMYTCTSVHVYIIIRVV